MTESAPTKEQLLQGLTNMLRARFADEKVITLYKQNKCHFQIGVAGHEAIQVAAGHTFQPGIDWFYPYYRDMALCAALGMTDREFMMNAMNKVDDPNSHGRQMPMHYGHTKLRIVSQSSPTGTQFLQAVGCALGAKLSDEDEVVYVSAGEGTCAQGDFHEALNWASREKLPVIFLIQNNDYAISVHISEQIAGQSVSKLASGYENLAVERIDGTDYIGSSYAFRKLYQRCKNGKGPALVEALVPRLQSHSISDNHLKYRSQEDIDAEKKRCPIVRLESYLLSKKLCSGEELEALRDKVKSDIDAAAEWAESQPGAEPETVTAHTFAEQDPALHFEESAPEGEELFMVDALNRALDEELERDEGTFVFGQDVAHGKGGVFTVTANLTQRHGVDRVFNGPLAESSLVGVGIGMATRGLKPIVEIQFGDYVWTGMMQLRNELAMLHYRSAGDFSCPAVIRIAVGGYIHGGPYHSQNIEATFAHFPGLFIAYPSNAADAKGLLKAAVRSTNPVLFLEHKGLYRQPFAKTPIGDKNALTPFGQAKRIREGSDLTLVSWGALVHRSLVAAQELEKEGASVEVIDLRTIVPLDLETIYQSVKKTNRLLIAHEDVQFMGFGAEIAADLGETCFHHLDAPIRRVGMKAVAHVPHAPVLEEAVLPQQQQLTEAARQLLAW